MKKYLSLLAMVVTLIMFTTGAEALPKFGCNSGGYLTYYGINTSYQEYCADGWIRGCHAVDNDFVYYSRPTSQCKKSDEIHQTFYYEGVLPKIDNCKTVKGEPAYCADDIKKVTAFKSYIKTLRSSYFNEFGVHLHPDKSNRKLCTYFDGYYHINSQTCRWSL